MMTGPVAPLAATAARTVDAIMRNTELGNKYWHDNLPGSREFFRLVGEHAIAGEVVDFPPSLRWQFRGRPPGFSREFKFSAQVVAIRQLWKRHRIVYNVDPTLWEELGDSDLNDAIPAGIFSFLPHPDPYIHFPEPLIVDHGGNIVEHVVGVFLSGRRYVTESVDPPSLAEVQCSTTDQRAARLGMAFVGLMYHRDGRPYKDAGYGFQDMMWTHTSMALGVDSTVGEVWEECTKGFSAYKDEDFSGDPREDLRSMLRRAISLIIYLCATNADLWSAPTPPAVGRKRSGKSTPKPPKVVNVGYRIGAKIRAYRTVSSNPHTPTGRTVAPHVRRAHFHTFRFGKGRTQKRVQWLPPIPVNVDGDADKPTIISVD